MYMRKIFGFVLLISMVLSCKPLQVVKTDSEEIKTSVSTEQSDEINALIAPYKAQLEGAMGDTVVYLKEDLTLEKPESTLGNHVAEVIYWAAQSKSNEKIDFSISNFGGIRVPYVGKGPLLVKDAYQIMPFDNYVVSIKIPGRVVLTLINHMAEQGGWPVHLLRYDIQDSQPINIQVQGESFDISKEYVVALTDYLATGGDHLSFLKDYEYINTNFYVRDAIIKFWETKSGSNEKIEAIKDGRVKIID